MAQKSSQKSVPEITPIESTLPKKQEPEVDKKSIRYQRDKMREKVRGMFRFDEAPGHTLSFIYREFPGDPIERYDLEDGKVYSLPLGVARHINKNLNYPVHRHTKNEDGTQSMLVGRKVQRATFQSLEFVDIDDIEPSPDLLTVQTI